MSFKTRVLSIQSHVVSGYVGNKSAGFPLQVLGFEVDTINSVQFSNHTGYNFIKGQVLNSDELDSLVEGLKLNNIHHYSHLLTGYIGSKSFLESVKKVILALKQVNPDLIYVCDPVMGDNGKMYVPENLLPIYREEIIPLADIITPNQFEAEILSDRKIETVSDIRGTFDWFHSKGIKTIILSSSDLGSDDELFGAASSTIGNDKNEYRFMMPKFPYSFTGTGDLFAALIMAWTHLTENDLKLSIENTVATMQKVLHRTYSHAMKHKAGEKPTCHELEMKLVQSLDDIRHPKVEIQASRVDNWGL